MVKSYIIFIRVFHLFQFKRILNFIFFKAQVILNKNLNEVFSLYGCVNYLDGYQQLFSHTSNLAKSYCMLTLKDMENVNKEMSQLLRSISFEKQSIKNLYYTLKNSLEYCSKKEC